MLQLILSGVGGGKTTHILSLIDSYARSDRKMTLIVPEQFSFTMQKLIIEKSGAFTAGKVDIISFTDLAYKLLNKPAYYDKRRMNDSVRAVLMRKALINCRKYLRIFGKYADKKSTVNEFLSVSAELKQSLTSFDDISKCEEKIRGTITGMKFSDIVLVLKEYDRLVEEKFFDKYDLLSELVNCAEIASYFENRVVFIDSFRGFTTGEYSVIDHILKHSLACYITLCAKELKNPDDKSDLFYCTYVTANRLYSIADKSGVKVAKPLFLSLGSKFNNFPPKFEHYHSPELYALEESLFDFSSPVYDEKCDNIVLIKSPDIYRECDFAVATVKRMINSGKYRCRDFLIVCSDMQAYRLPLAMSLKKYKIDYFDDARRPVYASPVINLFMGCVRAVTKSLDNETVFKILKTGLYGFSEEQVAEIENYAYLWNIGAKDWKAPFTKNPDGYLKFNEESEKRLAQLNETRIRIIEPLTELKENILNATGKEISQALYSFLVGINVPENLKKTAFELSENGDGYSAIELDRMWTFLTETLNDFYDVIGDEKLTLSEIYDIFDIMISSQTVGTLPAGLDMITVSDPERMRTSGTKVSFIMGVNDGKFPGNISDNGILTLKDRAILESEGITVSESKMYKLAQQKLTAYNSFCVAKDKVFVSFSEKSAEGAASTESDYYLKIKSLFKNIREINLNKNNEGFDCLKYFSLTAESAFEQYAVAEPGSDKASIRSVLEEMDSYCGKIDSIDRFRNYRSFKLNDEKAIERLFGKTLNLSSSTVNKFYECPFSFFCRYSLRAKPMTPYKFDPIQQGNVIHKILEWILCEHKKDDLISLDKNSVFELVSSYMDKYLSEELDGQVDDSRAADSLSKISDSLTDIVLRMIEEFSLCDFVPTDFEMEVGGDKLSAYFLKGETGNVVVTGYIDRVDTAIVGGERYFRVIDYKSGGKEFKLSDAIQGINMQMLIYLFALWQNGKGEYQNSLPAGVLYYQAKSAVIKDLGSDEKNYTERLKSGKMKGIVLDNADVIRSMEKTCEGVFIPARITDKGITGDVISLASLKRLKNSIDSLLTGMADSLRGGFIPAYPAVSEKGECVCSFCDYRSVCLYEDDIAKRNMFSVDNKKVIEQLNAQEVD